MKLRVMSNGPTIAVTLSSRVAAFEPPYPTALIGNPRGLYVTVKDKDKGRASWEIEMYQFAQLNFRRGKYSTSESPC